MAQQEEDQAGEKEAQALNLLQLFLQSERDLKEALAEIEANHAIEDANDWRLAEMHKHDMLVQSLKVQVLDSDPFRDEISF